MFFQFTEKTRGYKKIRRRRLYVEQCYKLKSTARGKWDTYDWDQAAVYAAYVYSYQLRVYGFSKAKERGVFLYCWRGCRCVYRAAAAATKRHLSLVEGGIRVSKTSAGIEGRAIGRVLVFAWTVQSQHSIVCWSTITCPTCSCCWLGVVNSFANVAIQFYSWGEKKVLDTWNFLIGNLDKRMWLFPVWGTAEREKKNETDWRGALDNLVLGKKAEPVGREVLQSMGA